MQRPLHQKNANTFKRRRQHTNISNNSIKLNLNLTRTNPVKFSEMFPGKYLKADDLEDGEECAVIIASIKIEEMRDSVDKPVLHFEDGSAMPLNKTNGKVLAKAFGDDARDWAGKEVVIYKSTTEYQGDIVPCLRIKVADDKHKPAAPALKPPTRPVSTSATGDIDDTIPFE
jgi:hypothetical protein